MRRTVAACRAFSLGLRPPVRPRVRAAARPSRVPSTISSRWNSSIAPRIWTYPDRPGRPHTSQDIRDLVLRLARENRRYVELGIM